MASYENEELLLDELMNEYDTSCAVLMSAYNGAEYIEAQVESILKQDRDFSMDIYIRDDGSEDDTLNILRGLARKEHCIHLIKGKHIGSAASFFALIHRVGEYDYYAFSDQDDYWLPNKLQAAVRKLSQEDPSIPALYGSSSYIVKEDLSATGTETQKDRRGITFYNTIIQNILIGHNQVVNAELLSLLKGEVLDFDRVYAHDLWIANLAAIRGTILFDNRPYTFYRQHAGNELGFGIGTTGWLTSRIRRAKHGEMSLIAEQMAYFLELHRRDMNREERGEMDAFFEAQDSFIKRLRYIAGTSLYRQKKFENFLFKTAYLFGKYNI